MSISDDKTLISVGLDFNHGLRIFNSNGCSKVLRDTFENKKGFLNPTGTLISEEEYLNNKKEYYEKLILESEAKIKREIKYLNNIIKSAKQRMRPFIKENLSE